MLRTSNRITAAELLALLFLLPLAGSAAGGHRPLQIEMLALHNGVRARVGVPPLIWSDRLASRAQDWANTLVSRNEFFHRPNSSFGENLFAITGAPSSPAEVIDAWAGESRDYNYRSNRCRGVCGHYTQLVWRNTREVGCAMGYSRRENREVWVCNYDPPGNYIGERPW
jgi:uncharacterized protein YkwD